MSSYDVMIEACDPGIRERVHQLQQWGFNTTDSGDGVASCGLEGDALDIAASEVHQHVNRVVDSESERDGE